MTDLQIKQTESPVCYRMRIRRGSFWQGLEMQLQDFGQERGRLTLLCDGQAWTSYWQAMGRPTVCQFLAESEPSYLVQKLQVGIDDQIIDWDDVPQWLKCQALEHGLPADLPMEELQQAIRRIAFWEHEGLDLLRRVAGPDFWTELPREPNPDYEWLSRLCQAVIDGCRLLLKEKR